MHWQCATGYRLCVLCLCVTTDPDFHSLESPWLNLECNMQLCCARLGHVSDLSTSVSRAESASAHHILHTSTSLESRSLRRTTMARHAHFDATRAHFALARCLTRPSHHPLVSPVGRSTCLLQPHGGQVRPVCSCIKVEESGGLAEEEGCCARQHLFRTKAESQRIVATRPLCHLAVELGGEPRRPRASQSSMKSRKKTAERSLPRTS